MSKQEVRYFIAGAMLLILTIVLFVLGIVLFNNLPNADASGYMDIKGSLMATGCFYLFLFSAISLVGTITMFMFGLFYD
jgi:hypothetical protein